MIGLGVALLGAALVIIGSFVDVHTYGSVPIQKNSFVAGGPWWILVAGAALGVAAVTPLVRIVSNAAVAISVPVVIAVGGGIYGLSASYQTLTLSPVGQELLGGTSVKGTPGAGVYLERLASLHTQGVLSDEEFADAKRRALRDTH